MLRRVRRRLVGVARARLSTDTKRRLRRAQQILLQVVGRRRRSRTSSEIAMAQAAYGAADYEGAAERIDRALRISPDHVGVLGLASQIAVQRGEIIEAGRHAVRRAVRSGSPEHWAVARRLIGRSRETDARWRPVLGPPTTSAAATPSTTTTGLPDATDTTGTGVTAGTVLYLAKESRPFLNNGFCTRSHETLRALVDGGRNVVGVTMPGFPGRLADGGPVAESVVDGVRYRHLLPAADEVLSRLGFDEYLDLTARLLAAEVAAERPAVLHVASGHRGYEVALAAQAVAESAGLPWLYEVRSFFETTWTADSRYAEQGEYYRRRFATEGRMMHAADLVVTLSEPMRAEIVERHGVPAEKVRVIGNAVDVTRFQPRPRDPALRRELGLDGTHTLGYVSNLSHPREGQEVLIEAVARLRRRRMNVTGLLVGDGKRRPELERLARSLGVARHVVFTGDVPFDRVADYYAQIDLFVIPRVDDRAARMVSPMKPFEAMAMRVPVLVSDLPALAEIVADGRGGRFTAGDPGALATAAEDLLGSTAEREEQVRAAAEWVRSERDWNRVASDFSTCYDDLTKG